MGCSTSQGSNVISSEAKENGINETADADRKYPPGEAFEVPIDCDPDSIIKKHPPKRLQRLVDAPTPQSTIEELEEKLANAELRRNQFLMERVNTLKANNDECICTTDDDKGNDIFNNETYTEASTIDAETYNSLESKTETEAAVSNNTSNRETQENN